MGELSEALIGQKSLELLPSVGPVPDLLAPPAYRDKALDLLEPQLKRSESHEGRDLPESDDHSVKLSIVVQRGDMLLYKDLSAVFGPQEQISSQRPFLNAGSQRTSRVTENIALFVFRAEQIGMAAPADHLFGRKAGDSRRALVPVEDLFVAADEIDTVRNMVQDLGIYFQFLIEHWLKRTFPARC